MQSEFCGFMMFLAGESEVFEGFRRLRPHRAGGRGDKSKKAGTSRKSGNDSYGAYGALPSKKTDMKKLLPYLDKYCQERQFVKDCTTTSKEDRAKLPADFRAGNTQGKHRSNVSVACKGQSDEHVQATGALLSSLPTPAIVLANVHGNSFACFIDSGADFIVI